MTPALALRTVRLVSGLILMAFVAGHLGGIAAGLVSLRTMEVWRPRTFFIWQTPPGLVVLYASLAAHTVAGLLAIAQRRSAQLTATDAAQLVLGLLIPPLLVLHVLVTRGAFQLAGFAQDYSQLLAVYWKLVPAYGLQQVFVVVIVWVHGCLGLYAWMRLKRWWPRVAGLVYPVAFALPILALLGFVEAGKEAVARLADDAAWSAGFTAKMQTFMPTVARLLEIQRWFLMGYAICVLAILLAFAFSAFRRRGQPVGVSYGDGPTVTARRGLSLLDVSREHDIPHAAICSGRGRCGTCRVLVTAGMSSLTAIGDVEEKVLRRVNAGPDVRLACQALLTGTGIVVERLLAADVDADAARHPEDALLAADTVVAT